MERGWGEDKRGRGGGGGGGGGGRERAKRALAQRHVGPEENAPPNLVRTSEAQGAMEREGEQLAWPQSSAGGAGAVAAAGAHSHRETVEGQRERGRACTAAAVSGWRRRCLLLLRAFP